MTTVATDYAPGIHYDIPELEYHALPGLSSTGIKQLLDSPARFKYDQAHRKVKREFDLGHVVHAMVLGTGLETVVVDAEEWRTQKIKDEVEAIRAEGRVPLRPSQMATARAMYDAVLAHPDARLFVSGGVPEASLIWDDPETGIRCRGRLDYLHGAPVVVDLKTARSADPRKFGKTAAEYGYDTQAAHYRNGLELTRGDRNPRFIHDSAETEPPHLVSTVELDDNFITIGAARVRAAIATYQRCVETDTWPGYPTGLHTVSAPAWHSAPSMPEEN